MSFLGIGGNTPKMQQVSVGDGGQIGFIPTDEADLAKQNAFVQQLQTQAAGGGPSVATQMLRNNQQAQAASTNAAIAGNRGMNAGLAARQALQTNSANNQATAGQAAASRMQEQLNAQGMLGNELNTMRQQSNEQNMANQQAQIRAQEINAGEAGQIGQNQMGVVGGVLGGAGALMGLAKGGVVPKMAEGGDITAPVGSDNAGPSSKIGQFLKGYAANDGQSGNTGAAAVQKGMTQFSAGLGKLMRSGGTGGAAGSGAPAGMAEAGLTTGGGAAAGAGGLSGLMSALGPAALALNRGGKVPAMVSPGERYLPPKAVKEVAEGKKRPMEAGKKIPGKAKVPGAKDSYANDTVKATLESGGIVLPRHVTQAKDAPERAAAFVRAVLAKQGLKK